MDNSPIHGPDDRNWGAGRPLPEAVEQGRGRTAVRLEPVAQGRDLVLLVSGGDGHVGAVAVCWPGEGTEPARLEVTVVPGHKEGPLAEECARSLAAAAQCTCCVVAGIHQDRATPDEIAAIIKNVRRGLDEIVHSLDQDS